jgi:hypothetical protein
MTAGTAAANNTYNSYAWELILLRNLNDWFAAVGDLNALATSAMMFRAIYPNGVTTPDAHKSSVLVREHRNVFAIANTVQAPDD